MEKYTINWKETLTQNIFWYPTFALLVWCMFTGNKYLTTIPNNDTKPFIVLCMLFIFLMLLKFVGMPTLVLDERE